MTQTKLAEHLDLHREAISAIEGGKQTLTVPQLVIVLRVLRLDDPDTILSGVPDITPRAASYA
jgi:plasmid maintenance system antidote protein VapI